jgi:hypothetical protein
MQLGFAPPFDVMAGLVPAIHAALPRATFEVLDGRWAWMPGTRPGMTCCDCTARIIATESCSLNSLAPRENKGRMSVVVDEVYEA